MEIQPVAYIRNDFTDKFAVPRQSGIAEIRSEIIFEKEYADENAVRGLKDFSHLWLIWGFSKNESTEKALTVRPPRLGGNVRVGVFASRSPFRPNNLGLSSVKLERIEYRENRSPVLIVSGADLMDGTPIYDIKPYIRFTDSHEDAVSGFADTADFPMLEVHISDSLLRQIPEEKHETLKTILKNDPRPAYHSDGERIYGFRFADKEIKFNVKDHQLFVISIENGQ